MRVSASLLLLLSLAASSASAIQHQVHLQVLSVLSQTVRGVGVGSPAEGEFKTLIPCSKPYPSDTVGVVQGPGSVNKCVLASPSHQSTGSVQNRRVEAILATAEGRPITSCSVAKNSTIGALHWLSKRTTWDS